MKKVRALSGHHHDAGHLQVIHRGDLLREVDGRADGHAALLAFLARVHLQQHGQLLLRALELRLELFREAQRIDRLDHAHHRQQRLDLVALEVADLVPAQFGWDGCIGRAEPCVELAELAGPLDELLHAVLTEVADAELDDLADLLGCRVLGDGNERHRARVALRLRAGGGDAGSYVFKAIG